MKAYQFRLQPVLEHREHLQDIAAQTVAEVERRIVDECAAKEAVYQQYLELTDRVRHRHALMSRDDLQGASVRADYLVRLISAHTMTIASLQTELDAARTALMQAAKERRVLESLKARRSLQHRNDAQRLEHAVLDDANGRRQSSPFREVKDSL